MASSKPRYRLRIAHNWKGDVWWQVTQPKAKDQHAYCTSWVSSSAAAVRDAAVIPVHRG